MALIKLRKANKAGAEQLGQPVAVVGATDADRQLVSDQFAPAVGEDGRPFVKHLRYY